MVKKDSWVQLQKNMVNHYAKQREVATQAFTQACLSRDAYLIDTNGSLLSVKQWSKSERCFSYRLINVSLDHESYNIAGSATLMLNRFSPGTYLTPDKAVPQFEKDSGRSLMNLLDNALLISFDVEFTLNAITALYQVNGYEYKPQQPLFDLEAYYGLFKGYYDVSKGRWHYPLRDEPYLTNLWVLFHQLRDKLGDIYS